MEIIANVIAPYIQYINLGFTALGVLVIVATVVVKLTPSASDNEKLDRLVQYIQKIMAYLPTLGINPNTKKLLEWYEEQKGPQDKK